METSCKEVLREWRTLVTRAFTLLLILSSHTSHHHSHQPSNPSYPPSLTLLTLLTLLTPLLLSQWLNSQYRWPDSQWQLNPNRMLNQWLNRSTQPWQPWECRAFIQILLSLPPSYKVSVGSCSSYVYIWMISVYIQSYSKTPLA